MISVVVIFVCHNMKKIFKNEINTNGEYDELKTRHHTSLISTGNVVQNPPLSLRTR